jgi:hypothetical protein
MRAPSESINLTPRGLVLQGDYIRQSGEVIDIQAAPDLAWVTFYGGDLGWESWHTDPNGDFLYSNGNLCQSWPTEEIAWVRDQIRQ